MITLCTVVLFLMSEAKTRQTAYFSSFIDLTLAMSFRDIVAEVQNLTEDEKRQLLALLERDLCNRVTEESPEFLAMLESRAIAANQGGRTLSLAQAREALKNFVRQRGQ